MPDIARILCPVDFSETSALPFAVEILRVAAKEQADLVVMGVHGRNAIDMMLFGSTTNQVVRRAICPVLTLRN